MEGLPVERQCDDEAPAAHEAPALTRDCVVLVFAHLGPISRLNASQVCRLWRRVAQGLDFGGEQLFAWMRNEMGIYLAYARLRWQPSPPVLRTPSPNTPQLLRP